VLHRAFPTRRIALSAKPCPVRRQSGNCLDLSTRGFLGPGKRGYGKVGIRRARQSSSPRVEKSQERILSREYTVRYKRKSGPDNEPVRF